MQYSINERPQAEGKVALSLRCGTSGSYTIGLADDSMGNNVYLEDHQNGTVTELTPNAGYSFSASQGDIKDRFFLSLSYGDGLTNVSAPVVGESESLYYNVAGQSIDKTENGVIIDQNGTKSFK